MDSIRSAGEMNSTGNEFAAAASSSSSLHLHIPMASSSSSSPPGSSRRIHSSSSGTTTSSSSSSSMTRRRRFVDWIQRQRAPRRLLVLQQKAAATTTSQQQHHHLLDSEQQQLHHTSTTFWITGLDRVLFGTVAAADAVLILGIQPPRYLWYMLSGAFCDIIQFHIDVFLHVALQIHDASVCWALGFLLSIVFRHSSHRYLVFGDYVGGYWASLTRMYAGYSVIIVLSTIFNVLMTRVAVVSHYVAWIMTLLWTGIANYFILKKLWNFGGNSSSSSSSSSSSNPTSGGKTMSSPKPPLTPSGK